MDDMTAIDETAEDHFTKSIEEYTTAIPSSAYLGVAFGAMALSLLCQATGRGKWGNFIAQWVPTYVKLEGHDRASTQTTEQPGEYTCEFCDSKFSFEDDLRNHQKHCRLRQPADFAGS